MMFPINFPDLTREAFLRVANHPGKYNPGYTLDGEAAAFMVSYCGVSNVVLLTWVPDEPRPRAWVMAPVEGKPYFLSQPWEMAPESRILYPLSNESTPLACEG